MKTELKLDYETLCAGKAATTNLVISFTAPHVADKDRRPIAFGVVIDRSGSMEGRPLVAAKDAAKLAVRNLRLEDRFTLVVFDDEAQCLTPLQMIKDKKALLDQISAIETGGSTNICGGWSLGHEELGRSPDDMPRRLLLLTDGQVNVGITEPERVTAIAASGLERSRVRTSCLGFGDAYNEDLLAEMAKRSSGTFYNANDPEQLPMIFAEELEGLQSIAVQNLRVRVKPLDFCDRLDQLSDYPRTELEGGVIQFAVGDLVSDEQRHMVLQIEVPALPCAPDGSPVATLEGEQLVKVEIVWDAILPESIEHRTHEQIVRIQAVQNPEEVRVNVSVLPFVASQRAGKVMESAMLDLDKGHPEAAALKLKAAMEALRAYGNDAAVRDGLVVLAQLEARINADEFDASVRKDTRSMAKHMRATSTSRIAFSSNYEQASWTKRVPLPSSPPPVAPDASATPKPPPLPRPGSDDDAVGGA